MLMTVLRTGSSASVAGYRPYQTACGVHAGTTHEDTCDSPTNPGLAIVAQLYRTGCEVHHSYITRDDNFWCGHAGDNSVLNHPSVLTQAAPPAGLQGLQHLAHEAAIEHAIERHWQVMAEPGGAARLQLLEGDHGDRRHVQ